MINISLSVYTHSHTHMHTQRGNTEQNLIKSSNYSLFYNSAKKINHLLVFIDYWCQ